MVYAVGSNPAVREGMRVRLPPLAPIFRSVVYRYKKIKLPDGSTIDEHRLVWERAYGPIPKGGVIHHRNGDGRDNKLENLKLVSRKGHFLEHPEVEERWRAAREEAYTIHSPQGMSWCSTCQQHLPRSMFGTGKRYNGLHHQCKPCVAERVRLYRLHNR